VRAKPSPAAGTAGFALRSILASLDVQRMQRGQEISGMINPARHYPRLPESLESQELRLQNSGCSPTTDK
jgi:hypothetical protein